MATTKLEKLMFQVGMQEKASRQTARMQAAIKASTDKIASHFRGIGTSALAAFGAAKSIQALAAPAVELNRALSLAGNSGADPEALRLLQTAAGNLALNYGLNAKSVIESSAGMQKAVRDLTSRELTDFTVASNLLAKAGRVNAETTTAYIGSMYDVFTAQAERMGKSRWAAQLAGQTDFVAKVFHATGDELGASFTALGQKGVKAGVDMGEQMAVLAALQKNMGGADAGKSYAAFLDNAARAQKRLGIQFKDQNGDMLSMGAILDQVKAKYGDTLTEAQQVQFAKAFGDDNAGKVINTLLSQSDKLGKTVADVRKITGLTGVRERARANTDAFERWGETVGYLRANFMQKLLPTLERWTNKATDNLAVLNAWVTKYPNVARVLGYVLLAVAGLAGVVAIATLAFHVWKLTAIPVMGLFKGGALIVNGMTAAVKFLNMAIRANPLGLLVTVLIACFFWGDKITAMFGGLWNTAKDLFSGIPVIGAPLVSFMEAIEARWKMFTGLFEDFTWVKLLKMMIVGALTPIEAFVNGIGWLLDKVGVDIGKDLKNWSAMDFADSIFDPVGGAGTIPQGPVIQTLASNGTAEIPQGGVIGAANSRSTSNSRTTTIGEQHFYIENPSEDFVEQMYLMAD